MLPKKLQHRIVLLSTSIQDLIEEAEAYFEARLAEKEVRIQELEGQLAQNSSRPPSTDAPYDKPEPRIRRTNTNRKVGGQK